MPDNNKPRPFNQDEINQIESKERALCFLLIGQLAVFAKGMDEIRECSDLVSASEYSAKLARHAKHIVFDAVVEMTEMRMID